MSNTLQDLMYGFFKDPNAYSTQFLNGTGAPGALAARKGDYYLNNSNGDMYYYNGTAWSLKTNLNTATGVTDHGLLSGLTDDDHPQYLNNSRGDARYATPDYVNSYAAQSSIVGNLLTANQASGTDTLGTTTGFQQMGGATTGSSAGTGVAGGRSVLLTNATASPCSLVTPMGANAFEVREGFVHTAVAKVKLSAGTPTARVVLRWVNSANVNFANDIGATVTVTETYAQISHTAMAPAGAVRAYLDVQMPIGNAVGNAIYVDDLGFWAGAGGNWAMPGTPITNLGTLVTHPNVDDVLVQRWDSGLGRWQTVHYDSGVRDILTALHSDAVAKVQTWTVVRVRRVNNTVTLHFRGAVGTGTANGTGNGIQLWSPTPAGFEPSDYAVRGWGAYNLRNPIAISSESSSTRIDINAPITAANGQWGNGVLSGEVSWTTAATIPASLPGTLVIAAPA